MRAEEIYRLGQGLHADVRDAAVGPINRLAVRLSAGISKLAARGALAARGGLGVFPISRHSAEDRLWLRGLRLLGRCEDLFGEIHAVRSRRGLHRPLARQVVESGRG